MAVVSRRLTINVPNHRFEIRDDDRAIDHFLEWFQGAGPDDVTVVGDEPGFVTYVQKRMITHARVQPSVP
jgi:hypothetical protein